MTGSSQESIPMFMYWTHGRITGFDELFPQRRGIERPVGKPLVVIVRGSPGSGKSTLALQLACWGEARDLPSESKSARRRSGIGTSAPILAAVCLGSAHKAPRASELVLRRQWAGPHARCVFYYVIDDAAERIQEKLDAFRICPWLDSDECAGNGKGRAVESSRPVVQLVRRQVGQGGRSFCREGIGGCQPAPGETVLYLVQYTGNKGSASVKDGSSATSARRKQAGPLSFDDVKMVAAADLKAAADAGFQECAVVIDSITPLKSREIERTSIERFFSCFTDPRTSLIVVTDEEGAQMDRDPYITDVMIRLWQSDPVTSEKEYCERYLQIVKASNCLHVRGPQKFRILPKVGVTVLPSLVASAHTLDEHIRHNLRPADSGKSERPPSLGIENWGLEEDECIQKGSSTTLVGPRGCFKTPIALTFCRDALKRTGGKAAFITLHEMPDTIYKFAKDLGVCNAAGLEEDAVCRSRVDADSLVHIQESHRLVIQYVSLAFMPPESFLAMVRRLLGVMGHSREHPIPDMRVVIDAISDLKWNYPRLTGVPGFLAGLLNVLAVEGVTSLFVFDDNGEVSTDDRAIVAMTDNTFVFQKQTVEGATRVLMDSRVVGSRFRGGQHIAAVNYADRRKQPLRIMAERLSGEYYMDHHGHLTPAPLRLYVNRCSNRQAEFNRRVCKRFGLAETGPVLDEELAHGSYGSVLDFLRRLQGCKDGSYVAAVDLAYLNPELLDMFVPIDLPEEDVHKFINVSTSHGLVRCQEKIGPLDRCRGSDGKLRVLPTHVDCSLMLCNLKLLARLGRRGQGFRRIKKVLEKRRAANSKSEELRLPEVALEDICAAAKEYQALAKTRKADCHFLGYGCGSGPNPEPLICMFFGLMGAHRIGFAGLKTPLSGRSPAARDLKKWMSALRDYALFYLPSAIPGLAEPRTAANCVFFHTWHSLAVSEGVPPGCVPVKFGRNWMSTRGGWCWGAVDNGLCLKSLQVAQFATSELMNSFLIASHAGLPPRLADCHETGILSVHNSGLIRRVIENDTWSRAHVRGYPEISEHAHLFFNEFCSFVESLGDATASNLGRLTKWLNCVLGGIIERISEH